MRPKLFQIQLLLAMILVLNVNKAWANLAQPVPIPEDPSTMPQIQVDGVGVATLEFQRSSDSALFKNPNPRSKGQLNFSDSAVLIGAAQRLYHSGIGSLGLGTLTTDDSNRTSTSSLFLQQAFVDYQDLQYEILIGRSDNPTAHLVDFPTLRGDDLITLMNPLNPYANGKVIEEHRYANVASFSINQSLKYFENIHVQNLLNSIDPSADGEINSIGASIQYLGPPGLENLQTFSSFGIGYEHIKVDRPTSRGLDQLYAGGVINLNQSVTNIVDLRFHDIASVGSDLGNFSSMTDTFEADSNAVALALRYLHSPFGKPGYQVALTAGYKNYFRVVNANSAGFALTGVKRLGQGFDFTSQYLGQWRNSDLANLQTPGLSYEQTILVGFAFNFSATFNQHIGPRRSLLNQQHQYIPE